MCAWRGWGGAVCLHDGRVAWLAWGRLLAQCARGVAGVGPSACTMVAWRVWRAVVCLHDGRMWLVRSRLLARWVRGVVGARSSACTMCAWRGWGGVVCLHDGRVTWLGWRRLLARWARGVAEVGSSACTRWARGAVGPRPPRASFCFPSPPPTTTTPPAPPPPPPHWRRRRWRLLTSRASWMALRMASLCTALSTSPTRPLAHDSPEPTSTWRRTDGPPPLPLPPPPLSSLQLAPPQVARGQQARMGPTPPWREGEGCVGVEGCSQSPLRSLRT
jgi:hypothetical protein